MGVLSPSVTYVGLWIAAMLDRAALDRLYRKQNFAFDSQSRFALNRFAAKLAILSVGALAQVWSPWGLRAAIASIAMISALTSFGLAVFRHERPAAKFLNYWDEALWFVSIGVVALWIP